MCGTQRDLGVTAPIYFGVSCIFNNLENVLRNDVHLVLGKCGLDSEEKGKLNAIQSLHGVYNSQIWHEHEELRDICLYTKKEEGLSEKFLKLDEPVLTRWWLVGWCTCSFLRSSTI